MAISSVNQMVKDRLPYLNNVTYDPLIERKRIEVVYIMQQQSGKSDTDVELESNYTGLQNILFAAMIAWYQLKAKAVLTMGGDGSTGSTGGAKILKKAKADVTEAEFMLVKADDGSLISIRTDILLDQFKTEICDISRTLGWANPICALAIDIIPAFIIGCDFPNPPCEDFKFGLYPNGTI